jgi:glycosyltransferase involved in cell wall biosynthesis
MKIAIDCRPLQNRYAQHGIGTVVRNLLSHLVMSRCSTSLILCGKAEQPPLHCGAYRLLERPASHDWLWEQLLWPVDIVKMHASIFHSTVSLGMIREIGLPLIRAAKTVATVYDLTPLHSPSLAPHTRMKSFRIQKMAVRGADRVITISMFVKEELVRLLKVKEQRIRVLPLAVDEALAKIYDARPASPPDPGVRPFILAMGESEHKNIGVVLNVFGRLADRGFTGELRVVGALENQTAEVQALFRTSPYRERIIFTGEISQEQIVENYAACSLFLFPSLMEGFGLPVIEAMYCGAPVVTSNTTSLPEAGGSAALYFAPDDVSGMTAAAERLLGDTVYRNDIIAAGKVHARRRSWSEAAEMVIGIYEELGFSPGV